MMGFKIHQILKQFFWGLLLFVLLIQLIIPNAIAAKLPLSKQTATVVQINLGSEMGELKFFPDKLTFQTGKRYDLILQNNSPTKHYFTAKDFADAIWSQKVDAGNVEVKGMIHELELRPNTQAEWVFIPLKAGHYSLRCTIAGHTEAGMVGTLDIVG